MTVHLPPEPVRVLFHLDGGYTKVFLERSKDWGMVDFWIDWDIPTNSIPPDLRKIGSRFLLYESSLYSDEDDSLEDICAKYLALRLVRLESDR